MTIRPITSAERELYNAVVSHPLQSYEWGEFREKTGTKVIRRGFFDNNKLISGFTVTIHKIPHTPWTIGYLPKGDLPTKDLIEALKQIGSEEKCIFIQLEPNVQMNQESRIKNQGKKDWKLEIGNWKLQPATHPLFTKYTFILDITQSEEQLLAGMHPKTRYNIKVAKKHGVEIIEDNSEQAFKEYWKLMKETTTRQKFYAHTRRYHELMWKTLRIRNQELGIKGANQDSLFIIPDSINNLTAHLFTARYQEKILTTMAFFVFHDTLYYPYGASSDEFRNVMHSTLTMWEAIRFGKNLGLKKFDMWGAMGPNADANDPWFGFHTFKQRFGPEHVEFLGSFDLVINPILYQAYKLADKLRWLYLKTKK